MRDRWERDVVDGILLDFSRNVDLLSDLILVNHGGADFSYTDIWDHPVDLRMVKRHENYIRYPLFYVPVRPS